MPPPDLRLPEPLSFFIDRCLGTGDVPNAIRPALLDGEQLHLHDDLFAQASDDENWLSHVGTQRWVGLTKDDAIRRRPGEMQALVASSTAIFIFGSAKLRGEVVGLGFSIALPRIRKAIRRFETPLVGRVNQAGETSIIWHGGVTLARAIPIK